MGRLIEEVAKKRGHHITCHIDVDNTDDFSSEEFRQSDVAIEFSQPSAAVDNILHAFAAGVPVVSGTTGWSDSLPEIKDMCEKGAGTLFHSSNFSPGVWIFRKINRELAALMDRFPEYRAEMLEVHHVHKLDHPSGTAITIAEDIISANSRLKSWAEPQEEAEDADLLDDALAAADVLPIAHERRGEVPGIHIVSWDSPFDSITLTHSAKSREGFALGAVMAAEWLAGKQGFFTMDQMMEG